MIKILDKIKAEAEMINVSDLDKVFDEAWHSTKNSFHKLEASQSYACDMDANYQAYLSSNYNNLAKAFKGFYKEWPAMLKKSNIKVKRLHFIDLPLSAYLNYEMYFYLINEMAGEEIKCLDFKEVKEPKIDDFIIFDKDKIIINEHNSKGELIKSYYSENKLLIALLLFEFEILYGKGKDYKNYAKFNKDIVKIVESIYE